MHEVELINQLNSLTKNQREREMDKMHGITTKATYDTIEEIVNPPIYQLSNNFWKEIREPYLEEIIEVLRNCKAILKNGFDVNAIEETSFMDKFEDDVRKYTSQYI